MRALFLCCFFLLPSLCNSADSLCVRHLTVPGYPRLARIARLEGSVKVDVEIDANGKVVSAVGSGGHKLLNHYSEENIQKWVFKPSRSSMHHTITFTYRLVGNEEYQDPPPLVVLELPDQVEITSHPPKVVAFLSGFAK